MCGSKLLRRHAWPRGYKRSFTPDLLLDFNGRLEERAGIESTPSAMYGPGWGYYGVQELKTRNYKVWPVEMDIVDHEKAQSVRQGGVEGIVSTEMLRTARASLTDAVARVFEGYPFVAGQSVPVAPEGSGLRCRRPGGFCE